MKLHLPTALRRALLKVLAVSLFVTTGSASAAWDAKVDLGNTMFVGDSITNGAYGGLHSWRWEMHKILTDNGINYDEVGVMSGDNKGGSKNMRYGNSTFLNRHSSQNSARAFEIAERQSKGHFGGTGIQHWLGLDEPDGWSGANVEGYRLGESDKPVDTFFLLIGTNDLLSEGQNVHNDLSTKESGLIGRQGQGAQVSWSGNSDMDVIVDAMLADNANAQIVLLTVPTWGAHGNNNTEADYKAVEEYNKHLAEWVEHRKDDNVVLVDINKGLVDVASSVAGRGVDSFFFDALNGRPSNDHLHPSAQGELLLAGNVAKGLGYAGRTAGQVRKPATGFGLHAREIFAGDAGLTFAANTSLTGNWGTTPEGGFTLEFKTSNGIGNGDAGGWDTETGFTVSVGDGTHSGSLTLNEAYIKWGDTILYSMDMSDLTDAIRVAYVLGNNSQGLATGFYVWLGDQLIGEALTSGTGTAGLDGVKIENTTSGSVTLSDLAMDSTGSWAPNSDGFAGQDTPTIEPASSSSYSGNPGVQDWPGNDKMLDEEKTLTSSVTLQKDQFTGDKVGCKVNLSGASPNIVSNWSGGGELYVTVQEATSVGSWLTLDNVNAGNNNVDLRVRFSGSMTLPTVFCVLQNQGTEPHRHTGDIYVEFSGDLTVNNGQFSGMTNLDGTYHGSEQTFSVASFYESKTAESVVEGKITYVFNSGVINGRILGGAAYGIDDETTRVTGGVEIYLNGGTFNGDIYAGGSVGYIGGSKITITGGQFMSFADTVKRISAGGFGQNNKGGVANGGTAEVILENLTDGDGFAKWSGELSGGRIVEGSKVTRTLTLNNVTAALQATLSDFDKVKVDEGSEVTLPQLGGAKDLEVGGGSTLTLTAGSDDAYTGMTTLNGGTIVLESGVNFSTQTAAIDDDQIAESTTGVYEVKGGATLNLTAGAGEVRGNVEVQLHDGGALTLGEGATSPTDAVSLSKLVLNGGNSTLNVAGAWTLRGMGQVGTTASTLTIGGESGGSLAFSMGSSSLAGPVTLRFGSGVNYSGVLRVDAGSATADSHVLLEIGEILTTLIGARAGEGLTIELTGLSGKDDTWEGFQLFSTGETTALDETQVEALKGLLSSDLGANSGYTLELETGGRVFLQVDASAGNSWDADWDDDLTNTRPDNQQMTDAGTKWENELGTMQDKNDSAEFTQSYLALAGDAANWVPEGMDGTYVVRLSKGNSLTDIGTEEGSKLAVLGGKLYTEGTTGENLSGSTYIMLWAPETEHFHLLVGGSSFVESGLTASGGIGFSGDTHIQVQGGTVDYIVGGNHVTNSAATFAGNTYISVYEGGSALDEQGVSDMGNLAPGYGTHVRGGIVGGSTVTASSGSQEHVDFRGNSHIFIYTALENLQTGGMSISDGKEASSETELYHIVGGNAWIGTAGSGAQSMAFSGSSSITVDLTEYKNAYQSAERGFEKAIVGGNFSGEGAAGLTSEFVYDAQGDGTTDPHAVRITIRGTAQNGEDIAFLGGVNGASRRDGSGAGTMSFDAGRGQGILLDLIGGAYRDYVAGGFWFGGSRDSAGTEASYTGELKSDITVNLNGGTYWRVVGGSVNFNGNAKTSTVGNTVVTVTGAANFGMAWQGDTQETQPTQANLGLLLGGSFYSDTRGTFEQEGSTTLNVTGGTYDNTHIVAGDYVVYTASETKEDSASITGGTNLVLRGGGSDVKITSGIVVGGSYLSDAGSGGSVSVGATRVVVGAGVELNPMANHKVVLVGGNLLLDDGAAESQGGHTVRVNGNTKITVDGGTINGYIVGGNYTNNSATGQNTLETTGTISIDIQGGTVNGDVFGGHFSENTSDPDILILHDVNITMSGGTVRGLIFGGSLRKATSSLAEGEHPTQGDVLIHLTGGTVGGVYAAGDHYNTAGGAGLHVRTHSTRVELGSGVKLESGGQSGEGDQYIVVSGGYLRSADAATRANDFSTVGYDEEAKTWADECAVLSFTDNPAAYGDLQGTKLRFQDFDAVEVKEGTLALEGSQLLVMHKVSDANEYGNDSFAKMGAGSLVLGGGLRSFLGQSTDDVAVADFTGKIILDGGTLTLGGGGAQSLMGGLQVNMAGRAPGNAGNAFLQVLDDGTSFTVGELSASNKMEITLVYKTASGTAESADTGETAVSLKAGVYYIADGLVGLDPDSLEDYIDLRLWDGALEGEYECHLELRGENNEQLVLRVKNTDSGEWYWEGDKGGEWKPGDNSNWTHGAVPDGDESYKSDTFHFNSGADVSGEVKVASGIDISEGRIAVESGQYRFVQPGNVGGNYEGLKVSTLQVGEKGSGEFADVELALPTGNIGVVEIYDNGRLALAHGQAIQGGTRLKFFGNGEGILKYAEDESGHLPYTGDLSGQVSSESKTGLRIQVGNGAMDGKEAPGTAQSGGEGVVWAGSATVGTENYKPGINFAVENGIIKTGYKNFTLRLTDATNSYTGTIEAQEGKLTIEAAGGQVDIAAPVETEGAEGTVVPKLEVAAPATLELAATGNGGVTVSRAVSGAGTLSIGTTAKNQGAYTLAAAVAEDFTGTVRLVGDGTSSMVNVQDAAALGNAQSTLALAGRAIVVVPGGAEETPAAEGTATVSVAAITVEGTNYVGGYGAQSDDGTQSDDVNKAITLRAANSITGNAEAVLANAQGGYTHTLEGDLRGFTGTIAAGVATDSEIATAETAPESVPPEEPAAPQSTWTLGGTLTLAEGSTSYTLATKLAGTGTIILNYTLSGASADNPGKVFLTGDVGDATLGQSVSVEHAMSGTVLVLAGQNNTSTGDLIFDGNEIWLGDETHASRWDGGVSAGSDDSARSRFVLRNGTLGKAVESPGVTLVVDTAVQAAGSGTKTVVDAGGTMGSRFDEIVINDGGHLCGVEGDITVGSGEGQTRLVLYFGQGNYGDGVSGNAGDYLIESTGDLVLAEVQGLFQDGPEDDLRDGAAFVLDFSNEGLFDLLKKHHDEGARTYLHVLSGGGIFFDSEETEEQLSELLRTGTYSKFLYGLSFKLALDGGDLVLRGSSSDIYMVLTDESDTQGNKHTVNTVEDAAVLTEKKATLLDRGTVLTVELGEGKAGETVTVHNLVGLSGTALEASGAGTVLLDNTEVLPDPVESDPWVSDKVDDPNGQYLGKLKGQDTFFDGMLRSADTQTQFVKSGAGTLTVGDGTENGGVNIAGELRLEDGDFAVRGGENGSVGALTFAYGEGSEHRKGFTVQGGRVSVEVINETGGGVVTVEQGTFAFVGDSTATGTMPGNLRFTGGGTLEIGGDEDGGKLALGGTSSIAGLNVRVRENSALSLRDNAALESGSVELSENGELDLSGAAHGVLHTVGTLSDISEGTGILRGGANTELTVKSGAFSGTLAGGGHLSVAANSAFSLDRVKTDATAPSGAWGISVQRGGTLSLDTTEQHGDAGPVFGDVVFGDDAHITLRMDYNADGGSTARMHSLSIGDGVVLTLESVSTNAYSGADSRVRIGYAEVEGTLGENVQVELKGVSFLHFEKAGDVVYEDGAYYVDAKQVTENKFERALPSMEKNAQAGASLFWSASAPSRSEALAGVLANPNSDLYLSLLGLTEMVENNAPGLANTLAAGAGASISVLGPALAEDIHRQLISVRNRTTTLSEDLPTDGYDMFPYWHAWITGEGGYHKLDADGFAPGYTLNNWGGSVGVDANVSPRTSVGLALTAMYGDLDTESADSTSGNIDTVYLSGFLRHAIGSWSHTIALSVGVADVKLDRTVNYGIGSYRAHGSTDGLAFGLLYEVGYTKFINKNGTFAVQPIANVELRHALIDGYTESGSDAGLKVDDIEQTVLTFGAGVRVQGLVGEHAFNNAATLEARALVKTDVGDRTGTSQHSLIHDTTQAEVESAEVGAVGVETGIGLSIPLGRNIGSILLDGSVEFRSGWTSANASVGYRISF